MALSLTDIRDSGLLELYALGELTPEVRAEVAAALRQSEELRAELTEIERSLQRAAFDRAEPVDPGVLDRTLRQLTPLGSTEGPDADARDVGAASAKTGGTSLTSLLGIGLAAALALAAYLFWVRATMNGELEEQAALIEACEERAAAQADAVAFYEALRAPGNLVIDLAPTEKYPEASLLMVVNAAAARNYLAVAELPALAPGQAYQLWSLKPDVDPIPLDVFSASAGIVPVGFEAGTGSYAITIEAEGGAEVPNLDALVGVLEVG